MKIANVIKNFDFSDYIKKLRDAVKSKELTLEIWVCFISY